MYLFRCCRKMFVVTICLLLFVLSFVQQKEIKPLFDRIDQDNPQDTYVELIKNCRCVIYYQCDENNFIIEDGTGLIDIRGGASVRIPCSDELYFCCQSKQRPLGTSPAPPSNVTTSSAAPPATVPSYSTATVTRPPVVPNNDSSASSMTPKQRFPTPTSPTTKGEATQIFFRGNDTKTLSCGKQKTVFTQRIFSDDDDDSSSTIIGEIPWIVAVFHRAAHHQSYKFKCAGSLIHPQVVLTSTHNIKSAKASELKVVANGANRRPKIGDNGAEEKTVAEVAKHPDYYSGGLFNDVALVFLADAYNITKSNFINTVCLPTMADSFEEGSCWAAGWGGDSKGELNLLLRKVNIPIVPKKKCEALLREQPQLGAEFDLHESFMCAGGQEGEDTCWGDGGGPLVCTKDAKYYQVGIVSWGVKCGLGKTPGVYTDVAFFNKWIKDEMKKRNLI